MLITGWGAPRLDGRTLDRMPHLRSVFHAAGSVKGVVSQALWARGVRVSNAVAANALPVAEYALAMILLSAKDVPGSAQRFARTHDLGTSQPGASAGTYQTTVGVIGASRTGRRLLELLRPFDLRPLVHDPSLDPAEAQGLGAELVPLPTLLARSRVVSVHAPELPQTYRMIGAAELAAMPDGATLINTARGSLLHTDALVPEVTSGRLRAVLDVTDPEPLPTDHPLWACPAVTLTPHVAGSLGNELRRIGAQVVDDVVAFASTGRLRAEVTADQLARLA